MKMNKDGFKSIIRVHANAVSSAITAALPEELIIISPHALSESTLLLISHDKLQESLVRALGQDFLIHYMEDDSDSIHYLRLKDGAGTLEYQIEQKNNLVSGLTPNVDIMRLIREVRLFTPSSQPLEGTVSFGIEFTFNNVLCAASSDTTDDSRVYGIVSYHPESQTLDIHCQDFIDNDLSGFEDFQNVIKGYADAFFNHPTIPFSQMTNLQLDIFSHPLQQQDYKEVLIQEIAQHFKVA